jgi:asparagine synthase (glutamine-hydrolysing)
MCGISGYYSFQHNDLWKEGLFSMNQILKHRGPDAEGIFSNHYCGLAHRRLSIIDLSKEANQPMKSANARYLIIFNGEIYNFNELSNKYLKGKTLRTKSDTEVLLELFAEIGTDCFDLLNGMFAGAILDQQTESLYLFRDSMGKKPLFYYQNGQNLAFASEIKALKKLPNLNFELNKDAITYYLHTNFIPEPITIYKNIFKLKAGNYIKISNKAIEQKPYSKPITFTNTKSNISVLDAKKEIRQLLEKSVAYRLISDVPYGTLLSGGVDSSLVTAIAQQVGGGKLKTFTIGFQDGWLDESKHARKISSHFGTEHYELILDINDSISLIDNIFTVYDEPFGDTSALPVMLVSQLVKQNAKMVLTGDGGDELFMGYGTNIWAQRLENRWLKMAQPFIKNLSYLGNPKLRKLGSMLDFETKTNLQAHIFSQEQGFFTAKQASNILNSKSEINLELIDLQHQNKLSPSEKQSLWDMTYYLREDLLVKIDRASMFHSLEMRSPFLDKSLISYSLQLSESLKLYNGTGKLILKEILKDYLPLAYFDRPKQGFAIPLSKWLRTELRNLVEIYAGEKVTQELGLLNVTLVNNLRTDFLQGKDYLFHKIWLIVSLQKWLKTNI